MEFLILNFKFLITKGRPKWIAVAVAVLWRGSRSTQPDMLVAFIQGEFNRKCESVMLLGNIKWACFDKMDREVEAFGLVVMEFEVNWRMIIQRAMRALAIVEGFNVIEDVGARLSAGEEVTAVNEFEFEGAPEAFHGGIVVAVAFATHGG